MKDTYKYNWRYCEDCNEKRQKIKTNKYIISTIILSIICFLSSLIGIKIADIHITDETLVKFVIIFIGIFSLISFGFIVVWTLIGTIVGLFPLFSLGKNKKGIITSLIILSLLLFLISILSIYYFVLISRSFFVDNFNSSTSMSEWFNGIKKWFIMNLGCTENCNFIMLFTFSIAWSVLALIYKIIYQSSTKNYKVIVKGEKSLIVPNDKNNVPAVVSNIDIDNNAKEENKNNVKEEIKPAEIVEEKKTEEDNKSSSILSENEEMKNEEEKEESKQESAPAVKHDPNDPASIFD